MVQVFAKYFGRRAFYFIEKTSESTRSMPKTKKKTRNRKYVQISLR